MKFIYGFLIAVFLVTVSSQSTPVKKCQNGPLPSDVRIEGCPKSPCLLVKGTNVTAEWDFTVSEDTNKLNPRVRLSVFGNTLQIPTDRNACRHLKDVQCPLKAGQQVTYTLTMPVEKKYPKLPVIIEFSLLNDNKNIDVCFRLATKVVDK